MLATVGVNWGVGEIVLATVGVNWGVGEIASAMVAVGCSGLLVVLAEPDDVPQALSASKSIAKQHWQKKMRSIFWIDFSIHPFLL